MVLLSDLQVDRRVQEEARSLNEAGFSITIIYPLKIMNNAYVFSSGNIKVIGLRLKTEKYFHRYKKILFHLGTLILFGEFLYRLITLKRKLNANFTHAHDLNALLVAWIASAFSTKKIVYDSHELYPDTIANPKISKFWSYFEGYITPKLGKRIISTNDERADHMFKKYKLNFLPFIYKNTSFKRIEIQNVKASDLMVELKKKWRVIVHIGAITNNRDLDNLCLSALDLTDYTLVFVGKDNNFIQKNIDLIDKLGERFIHIDQVRQEEIYSWLKLADIGVVFYRQNNLNNIFSASNKIYDYMTLNLPILGSDSPTIINILNENQYGEVVDSSKAVAIVEKIKILENRKNEIQNNYKLNSNNLIDKYSRKTQNMRLIEFYSNLKK